MSPHDPGLALPVLDPELRQSLVRSMTEVEERLEREVRSEADFVTEACRHLLHAGGKRFRPLLALLSAHAGQGVNDDVVTAACVVELTHLASLYHDDVMDEAVIRRGASSANAVWDNHVAILAGDWLFARSSALTARLGPEAVAIQAETFGRLVEGQILETRAGLPTDDPLQHYLRVVAGKTGSLIATSARYGAMFGGATPEVVAALTGYGERVGVAFQLADDILDLAADAQTLGKAPGTDLREGVPTLPTLMAMRSAEPRDARLRELLAAPITDDDNHAEALELMRSHESMLEARAYVLDLARSGVELLAVVPDGPVRQSLVDFADLVATRAS